MNVTGIYPVLMTDQVEETAEFYRRHFDFEDTFTADWYVSLKHKSCPNQELAVLQTDHPTIPDGYNAPCRGVLINVEVEDARTEHDRLVRKAGLTAVVPLRDEAFGHRHFILRDPAGNLVDVIQNIDTSEEFADNFV